MATEPFAVRSLDQLEADIISLSQRLNSDEYAFLVDLREFDLREGWKAYHFNHCAEWVNVKCGISLGAAREKLRVALALFDLPEISNVFAAGDLSYSKARALTRVADRDNERKLLDFALRRTASQVEEHCRQLRNAQRRPSTDDANRAHRSRYLCRSAHDDGTMTISVELPREQGELVMKAIELAMVSVDTEGCDEEVEEDGFFARQADALVEISREYVSGGNGHKGTTADQYQVMVRVDEAALREGTGRSDLPIESVRRILCDSGIVAVLEDDEGNPLDLGRKHRVVSSALRRALVARDGHCRFPGCSHDKWLDAHHVMHWADGGDTNLENILLLCTRHHRLLHEGGFTIQRNFAGRWYFRNASGSVIPDRPWCATDASRDGPGSDSETVRASRDGPGSDSDTVHVSRDGPGSDSDTVHASRDGFIAEPSACCRSYATPPRASKIGKVRFELGGPAGFA